MIGTILGTIGFIVGGTITNVLYDLTPDPKSKEEKAVETKEPEKKVEAAKKTEEATTEKKEEKFEKISPDDVEVIKPEDVKTIEDAPSTDIKLDAKELNDLANEALIELNITEDKDVAYMIVCTMVMMEHMAELNYVVDIVNKTSDGSTIANSIMYVCKEKKILPTSIYDLKEVADIDSIIKINDYLAKRFPQSKFEEYKAKFAAEKAKPDHKFQDIIFPVDGNFDFPRFPRLTYKEVYNKLLKLFPDTTFRLSVRRDVNGMINEGMGSLVVEIKEDMGCPHEFDVDFNSLGGIGICILLPVLIDPNNLQAYEMMPVNIEKHPDIIYRFIQNKFAYIGSPIDTLGLAYDATLQSQQDAMTIMKDQIPLRQAYVMFDFTGFDFYTMDEIQKNKFCLNLANAINRDWEKEGIPRCRYRFVSYTDPDNFKCISDKEVRVQDSSWMLLPSQRVTVELECKNSIISAKIVNNN